MQFKKTVKKAICGGVVASLLACFIAPANAAPNPGEGSSSSSSSSSASSSGSICYGREIPIGLKLPDNIVVKGSDKIIAIESLCDYSDKIPKKHSSKDLVKIEMGVFKFILLVIEREGDTQLIFDEWETFNTDGKKHTNLIAKFKVGAPASVGIKPKDLVKLNELYCKVKSSSGGRVYIIEKEALDLIKYLISKNYFVLLRTAAFKHIVDEYDYQEIESIVAIRPAPSILKITL